MADFSRTIGFLTKSELMLLAGKLVAIAGLGGVGGRHLMELVRLGVGCFHVADPDIFEAANANRQYGANVHTYGEKKADILPRMAQAVNPDVNIRSLREGVSSRNLDSFLEDVDVYVDGLDFFAVETRRMVFNACYAGGIPIVTAAPLGWSTSLLVFMPDGIAPDEYFQFKPEDSKQEQLVKFLVGLAPRALHRKALVDTSTVDFMAEKGPSTGAACALCASVVATTVTKILTGRGEIIAAPHSQQFDPWENKWIRTRAPWWICKQVHKRVLVPAARRMLAQMHDKQQSAQASPVVETL